MPDRRRPRGPSLFEGLVFAPDRDRIPGARPVVSFAPDDDADFLRELDATARARFELSRRGVPHGSWAELDLARLGIPARQPRADAATLRRRWNEARPLVLPGIATEVGRDGGAITAAFARFEALADEGALHAWIRSREAALPEGTTILNRRARLADPERDIEKVELTWQGLGSREVRDLWIKSAWLSTHADDASLRLRFSFGREVEDDASRDDFRHRLVAELANALLSEARELAAHLELAHEIETAVGEESFFTQHIAYWNGPEGGASFHHDAFDESPTGGQLGVCFVQLAGRTAWLALSIADLAERAREFVENLRAGALPWLRDQLFPRPVDFERVVERAGDERALLRELALPGCGSLAKLVNRGPEFTSFLADGGHALVLEPGDALLLPNRGLARTAMHSVFCASEEPTYALSMAIRSARPRPEPELEAWEAEAHGFVAPPPPAIESRAELRRLRRESKRRSRN